MADTSSTSSVSSTSTPSTSSTTSSSSIFPTMPTTTTQLSDIFKQSITSTLAYEQQPLDRMKLERDALNARKAAYKDLTTQLQTLQTAVRALTTSLGSLSYSRAASITPGTANTTVATASAGSAAIAGNYDLQVTTLAKSFIWASTPQSSATDLLGKTGTFLLGGNGVSSASKVSDTADLVSSVSTSAVASGFTEIGKDNYTIETRSFEGKLQFRMKDLDGTVMSIGNKLDNGATLTTGWQDVAAGEYNTQRGMKINFTGGGTAGTSATLAYQPAGTSVTVVATDSLISIANKINATTQPEGRQATATVIGNQLILSSPTGANNQIDFTDNTSGGGLGLGQTQAGVNASFKLNNVIMSRQSNTNLSDVINGVVLNLAGDAEGKSATIKVTSDSSSARGKIDEFIKAFNDSVKLITDKMAITQSETSTTTYTRGALANDTIFNELKESLFDKVLNSYSGAGTFSMLNEIGISLDDNLKLSVTDSTKLENALSNNYSDVTSLLDKVMTGMDSKLTDYTGASGFMTTSNASLSTEFLDLSSSIQDFQVRMITRKSQLETQYASMQADLLAMQYTFNTWKSMYSATTALIG